MSDLRANLMAHLSSEIASQTAAMVTWRSRINFASYFGPWIIFGGYFAALRRPPALPADSSRLWIAASVLVAMYLVIGLACGWVEHHVWDQQNHWRRLICRLSVGGNVTEDEMTFAEGLRLHYVLVYVLMLITLVAGIIVISELTPPNVG